MEHGWTRDPDPSDAETRALEREEFECVFGYLATRSVKVPRFTEDQAMTEGMGYVCDRTEEHLGSSDVAIIHMRRMMLRMLDNFEKGIEPYAPSHPEVYRVQPLDVESDRAELHEVLEEYRQEALIPA